MNNVNFGGYNPLPLFRPESSVLRNTDDVEMKSALQDTTEKTQVFGRALESVETVPFDSRRNSPNHLNDGNIMIGENTQQHSLLKYPFNNNDDNGIDPELAGFNNRISNKFVVINKKRVEILEQSQSDRASGTSSKMKNPIRRMWSPGGFVYKEVASSPFEGVPENEPAPSRLDHLQQPSNKKYKKSNNSHSVAMEID